MSVPFSLVRPEMTTVSPLRMMRVVSVCFLMMKGLPSTEREVSTSSFLTSTLSLRLSPSMTLGVISRRRTASSNLTSRSPMLLVET